ncbi:hypothetical protein Pelo_7125 [Pelomyxa schiedti]|nr:hypothetical protein Pelo_7125 [Pelomyxa schiedti]
MSYRNLERNLQSSYFLLPNPNFWGSTTLVKTPSKSYTAQDYLTLWRDANIPPQFNQVTLDAFNFTSDLHFPATRKIPMKCLYATGVRTPEMLQYFDSDWDSYPKKRHGDGDGTVNVKSLVYACDMWTSQGYDVETRTYPGVTHVGILANNAVISSIVDFVCQE